MRLHNLVLGTVLEPEFESLINRTVIRLADHSAMGPRRQMKHLCTWQYLWTFFLPPSFLVIGRPWMHFNSTGTLRPFFFPTLCISEWGLIYITYISVENFTLHFCMETKSHIKFDAKLHLPHFHCKKCIMPHSCGLEIAVTREKTRHVSRDKCARQRNFISG